MLRILGVIIILFITACSKEVSLEDYASDLFNAINQEKNIIKFRWDKHCNQLIIFQFESIQLSKNVILTRQGILIIISKFKGAVAETLKNYFSYSDKTSLCSAFSDFF